MLAIDSKDSTAVLTDLCYRCPLSVGVAQDRNIRVRVFPERTDLRLRLVPYVLMLGYPLVSDAPAIPFRALLGDRKAVVAHH